MGPLRLLSMAVLIVGIVAGIYYTASDKEAQGTVVVLLAILYFVALPQVKSP